MKKKILAFLLYYSGILWLKLLLMKIFGSSKLRILCYHRVLDIGTESFELDENVIDAKPSDFDRQMKFISRNFNVITLKELAEYKEKGRLPKNPLIITFDDGYEDNYTNAYPILKKYGLRATIFLAVDHMGTNKLLWWDRIAYIIKKTGKREIEITFNGDKYHIDLSDKEKKRRAFDEIIILLKTIDDSERQEAMRRLENILNVDVNGSVSKNDCLSLEEIKEMSESGIEFGSHTCTHPILTKLSDKMLREEISFSKSRIEKILSKPVVSFSYPNGSYNDKCKEVVKEAGFDVACSYRYGVNNISTANMYELNRITMSIDKTAIDLSSTLVFTKIMGIGMHRRERKESGWLIYKASKNALEIFFKFNKIYSNKYKLADALLKLPFAGLFLARLVCSRDITFIGNGENMSKQDAYSVFPAVKKFIKNNIGRILKDNKGEITDFSLVAYEHKRGINFYLLSAGSIFLFCKYIKYKNLECMLETECANITYLNSKLSDDIKESIPNYCKLENVEGHSVMFLNYMPGEKMSDIITLCKPGHFIKLEEDIMKALKWLVKFQKQTMTSVVKLISFEKEVESLLLQHRHLYADKNVINFFSGEILNEIRNHGDVEIPVVSSLGDFFPNNILLEKDDIRVIDWPDMEIEEMPTADVFSFFLSLRLADGGDNGSSTIIESFRFVFTRENWFSILVQKCFEWYCAEMKLDKRLLRILFSVYLLKRAVLEAQGTLQDKIVSPQEWGSRLRCYIEVKENFVLNSSEHAKWKK